MDWAAFGLDGSVHGSGLWTASLTNGMDITVSTSNVASGEGARTAANFGAVYAGGSWYNVQNSPFYVPAAFVGHFDAPSSPYTYDPTVVDNPGDHLMGLAGDTLIGSTSKSLIIDFGTTNLTAFAFRIAAVNLTSFNVTLNIFSGANGTGTSIGTYNLTSLTGGGNCPGLQSTMGSAPTPCNDANLLAAINLVNARSIQIQTNDPSGFYLGDIYMSDVPEPAPFVLAGCGLLLLAVAKLKTRKA